MVCSRRNPVTVPAVQGEAAVIEARRRAARPGVGTAKGVDSYI